jgi:hypothetical protein
MSLCCSNFLMFFTSYLAKNCVASPVILVFTLSHVKKELLLGHFFRLIISVYITKKIADFLGVLDYLDIRRLCQVQYYNRFYYYCYHPHHIS